MGDMSGSSPPASGSSSGSSSFGGRPRFQPPPPQSQMLLSRSNSSSSQQQQTPMRSRAASSPMNPGPGPGGSSSSSSRPMGMGSNDQLNSAANGSAAFEWNQLRGPNGPGGRQSPLMNGMMDRGVGSSSSSGGGGGGDRDSQDYREMARRMAEELFTGTLMDSTPEPIALPGSRFQVQEVWNDGRSDGGGSDANSGSDSGYRQQPAQSIRHAGAMDMGNDYGRQQAQRLQQQQSQQSSNQRSPQQRTFFDDGNSNMPGSRNRSNSTNAIPSSGPSNNNSESDRWKGYPMPGKLIPEHERVRQPGNNNIADNMSINSRATSQPSIEDLIAVIFSGYLLKQNKHGKFQRRMFRFDGLLLICLSPRRIRLPDHINLLTFEPGRHAEAGGAQSREFVEALGRFFPTNPPMPALTNPLIASWSENGDANPDIYTKYYHMPKWLIPTAAIQSIEADPPSNSRSMDEKAARTFTIRTANRDYVLRAESAADFKRWTFLLSRMSAAGGDTPTPNSRRMPSPRDNDEEGENDSDDDEEEHDPGFVPSNSARSAGPSNPPTMDPSHPSLARMNTWQRSIADLVGRDEGASRSILSVDGTSSIERGLHKRLSVQISSSPLPPKPPTGPQPNAGFMPPPNFAGGARTYPMPVPLNPSQLQPPNGRVMKGPTIFGAAIAAGMHPTTPIMPGQAQAPGRPPPTRALGAPTARLAMPPPMSSIAPAMRTGVTRSHRMSILSETGVVVDGAGGLSRKEPPPFIESSVVAGGSRARRFVDLEAEEEERMEREKQQQEEQRVTKEREEKERAERERMEWERMEREREEIRRAAMERAEMERAEMERIEKQREAAAAAAAAAAREKEERERRDREEMEEEARMQAEKQERMEQQRLQMQQEMERQVAEENARRAQMEQQQAAARQRELQRQQQQQAIAQQQLAAMQVQRVPLRLGPSAMTDLSRSIESLLRVLHRLRGDDSDEQSPDANTKRAPGTSSMANKAIRVIPCDEFYDRFVSVSIPHFGARVLTHLGAGGGAVLNVGLKTLLDEFQTKVVTPVKGVNGVKMRGRDMLDGQPGLLEKIVEAVELVKRRVVWV